jgi:hypothetical protein
MGMNEQKSSRAEQILDLLIDEIVKRLKATGPAETIAAKLSPEQPIVNEVDLQAGTEPERQEVSPPISELETEDPLSAFLEPDEKEPHRLAPETELDELPAMFSGPSHTTRLMKRLLLWLFVAVVLVNIPFTQHGTTLATAMPDAASYVVRDGFVIKEEDDQEIYVYQDGKFRWISSLEAFEHYGFTWGDVHLVSDGYLDRYEIGPPLHVLLKCRASPHIYRMEREEKRWIRDIDTFVNEGHVWEDVRFVSCQYLRSLPDGETIPPGSGPPPQP